nr:8314_t:CDS:10 [Entrophospora candida]
MFIGGLNWETSDENLKSYFSQFGEVTDCVVMRDPNSSRSRGFGFVTFTDPSNVDKVLNKDHQLDGKVIDPKRAIPRDEQEKTEKIFVGGIAPEVTEEEFKQYFLQFGNIVDATLMVDRDSGRPRGFGFITFDSSDPVEKAMARRDLEIQNKAIEVKLAMPKHKTQRFGHFGAGYGPPSSPGGPPPPGSGPMSVIASPGNGAVNNGRYGSSYPMGGGKDGGGGGYSNMGGYNGGSYSGYGGYGGYSSYTNPYPGNYHHYNAMPQTYYSSRDGGAPGSGMNGGPASSSRLGGGGGYRHSPVLTSASTSSIVANDACNNNNSLSQYPPFSNALSLLNNNSGNGNSNYSDDQTQLRSNQNTNINNNSNYNNNAQSSSSTKNNGCYYNNNNDNHYDHTDYNNDYSDCDYNNLNNDHGDVNNYDNLPNYPYNNNNNNNYSNNNYMQNYHKNDQNFDEQLYKVTELPDRFRSLFTFGTFNKIQSQCIGVALYSSEDLVMIAPTGSGKTVIFELAMINVIMNDQSNRAKMVYMAPTKAICSERAKDWIKKFRHINITCGELTGDTHQAFVNDVKRCNIIVTTPEKWESNVRNAKIIYVHMLHEDRGSILEVSRMKIMGAKCRIIAVSATIPNINDVAVWISLNSQIESDSSSNNQHQQKAKILEFGEEYRPVKLSRHVLSYKSDGNAFKFDKSINDKQVNYANFKMFNNHHNSYYSYYFKLYRLLDIIKNYSDGKPVMVFCTTRKSTEESCQVIVNQLKEFQRRRMPLPWDTTNTHEIFNEFQLQDKRLIEFCKYGILYHHAGLHFQDRKNVEKMFLQGIIKVICATSTLAVGVNLPAHLVIIKSTLAYKNGRFVEYSDSEVKQMLGRAGRPQFDDSGVAVIITSNDMKQKYEELVAGIKDRLESRLNETLHEHLNSEICLGTVDHVQKAMKWLKSTFLYVRMKSNPTLYDPLFKPGHNWEKRLEGICMNDLRNLMFSEMITMDNNILQPTNNNNKWLEIGEAMAKYHLKYLTMQHILSVFKWHKTRPSASKQEIIKILLQKICQTEEFNEVKLHRHEKLALNKLNNHEDIKFPLSERVKNTEEKIFIMIQCILGNIPFEDGPTRIQFNMESRIIVQHSHRITKCLADLAAYKNDVKILVISVDLARSISVKMWDDSSLLLRQIDGIGEQYAKKLHGAGIKNFDQLKDSVTKRHGLNLNLAFMACTEDSILDFRHYPFWQLQKGLNFELRIKITEPIQKFTCSVLPEEFLGLDIHQTIILDCDSGNILFAPIESNEVASPNQNVDDISNNVQQKVIPVQTFEDDINVELISPRQTRPRTITTSPSTLSNKSKEPLKVNSSKKSFELLPNGRVKCNHNCRDKQKCAHECCKIGCRRAPKNRKATNNNYNDNLRTSKSLISEGDNDNNSPTNANTNDNDHANNSLLLSPLSSPDDKRGDIEMLLWSNEQKKDENLKKQDDDDGEPNTIGFDWDGINSIQLSDYNNGNYYNNKDDEYFSRQDITEVEEPFETFATPNYINKQQQKQRSIEALCIFDYVFNTIIE